MIYLIQAYACSPYKGGEYAVSWGWITHLDNRCGDEDQILVMSITLSEKDIKDFNLRHVRLLPIHGMERWEFLNYNALYYRIWQRKAYRMVKTNKIKPDVCHLYSLSDFRQPGDWWKLECKTIFGPVGGGQTCPKSLQGYDEISSRIRSAINFICMHSPVFKHKIAKFDEVYPCNFETQAILKRGAVLPDVPLNDRFANLEISKHISDPVTILSVGRLINKKGILLLLDVLSILDTPVKWQCLIYGEGEERERINERINTLALSDRVKLMGAIEYNNISEVYRKADVFVLPSLRESGGSVLIEAAAHALPIVALKMSLAEILSRNKAGLFVNTNQSKAKIIDEFAKKIKELIENEGLRQLYGKNGYEYVNSELNWEKMISEVYGE